MALNMWGNPNPGFTKDFVRECGRTFNRCLNEALSDLIFNEVSFLDLTPEIYKSQNAKHKKTLEDLASYLNYLEQGLMKKLCDSAPHIVLLLEIRGATFGYHQQHLQCLNYIGKISDLEELSPEKYEQNKMVFGAYLLALKAKYKLLKETIFKVHGHKECDLRFNMLLEEYTRLKFEIWFDIEKIEGEVNDTTDDEIEPLRISLYDTRRKILYPSSRDLDMSSLFEIFGEVEESKHIDIYEKFQTYALEIQRKKEEIIRVCEALDIEFKKEGREAVEILRNTDKLTLTEYEEYRIGVAMLKVHSIQNTCLKLGQVVDHIVSKLVYLMNHL